MFYCINAEKYEITDEDCFYFFNPFSEKILRKVINQIIVSIYDHPRKIKLFFYYPDDEFITYLMGLDELICVDEIDCMHLYKNNDIRERILVFEINEKVEELLEFRLITIDIIWWKYTGLQLTQNYLQ